MKVGIHHPPFIPPLADIRDLFRIGAKISFKLVAEL